MTRTESSPKRPFTQILPAKKLAVVCLCALLIFAAVLYCLPEKNSTQPDFDTYTDLLFAEQLCGDTISLHYLLTEPEDYGITDYAVSLGSMQESDLANQRLSCENISHALESYNYDSLSTDQRVTYDILMYTLNQNLTGCDFYYYEEPLNTINGIQGELPVLLAEYSFYNQDDVEDYLSLLNLTPTYFDQLIDFEEKKSARGLFMPTFSCDELVAQINALLDAPAFSCLTETFDQKLTALGLPDAETESYRNTHSQLIEERLVPAYESLRAALLRLRDTTSYDGGLCHLENGSAYYSYLVKKLTGSNRSVQSMDELISEKRQQDLSDLSNIIKSNPDILSEMSNVKLSWNTPEEMLEHLKEAICTDFPDVGNYDYQVKTVDTSMQEFLSPAFYLTAPMDEPNENNIYINPSYEQDQLELFTTLAHEGYPGHLYETVNSYSQGFSRLRYLLNFGGYTEGWATYVEMRSYSYAGLDETLANALSAHASATLSLYASIDIGVHAQGWDRDVVLEFLSDYGITSEETADRIYELVVEAPGNYLKYYVGYLEFLELKKDAENRLGDAFDEKEFHRALLAIGPAPFSILQKYLPLYESSASKA
jgi:uncharacterized protein (DUF885 family)